MSNRHVHNYFPESDWNEYFKQVAAILWSQIWFRFQSLPGGVSKSENNLQSCLFQAENVKDFNEQALKSHVHLTLGQHVH